MVTVVSPSCTRAVHGQQPQPLSPVPVQPLRGSPHLGALINNALALDIRGKANDVIFPTPSIEYQDRQVVAHPSYSAGCVALYNSMERAVRSALSVVEPRLRELPECNHKALQLPRGIVAFHAGEVIRPTLWDHMKYHLYDRWQQGEGSNEPPRAQQFFSIVIVPPVSINDVHRGHNAERSYFLELHGVGPASMVAACHAEFEAGRGAEALLGWGKGLKNSATREIARQIFCGLLSPTSGGEIPPREIVSGHLRQFVCGVLNPKDLESRAAFGAQYVSTVSPERANPLTGASLPGRK